MDADYTAQMIRVMHTSGTPGFQTIVCYNIVSPFPFVVHCGCSKLNLDLWGNAESHPIFLQRI